MTTIAGHDPEKVSRVGTWLGQLARLQAGNMHVDEAKQRLGEYTDALAGRFAAWVFTRRSAEHVASVSKGWPRYGDVVAALEDWSRDNPPPPAGMLLTDGRGDRLEPMDRMWLACWETRRPEAQNEDQAARARGRWFDPNQLPLARLASLVRSQSPAAWAIISGQAQRGYRTHEPSDTEHFGVRRTVADLAAELNQSRPTQRSAVVPVQAPHGRALGALTPEHLAAERAAAGIKPVEEHHTHSARGAPA